VLRHPKDHWIASRDNDFELHIQTNVTLANIGYRIVLAVIPMAPVRSCRSMRNASLCRVE